MLPIPHSAVVAVLAFLAPLLALVLAAALPRVARRAGWIAASAPLALFAGWALLQPVPLLPHAVWAPRRGTETLLAPALVCVIGVALVAWRRGGQTRLIAVAVAAFGGWWVARAGVTTVDFWRVWFAVAALAWVLSKVMQARPDRLLVGSVALWGGLAVAGSGQGWLMAALVAVATGAGLLTCGAKVAVPAVPVAVLIAAADLAGGRLLRGRFDTTDCACLAAVAAPLLIEPFASRLRRLPNHLGAVLARGLAAAVVVAAVWLARRAMFT